MSDGYITMTMALAEKDAELKRLRVIASEAQYALDNWPGAYPAGLEIALKQLSLSEPEKTDG